MFIATQEWLHDMESNMRSILVDSYKRLLLSMWWTSVAAQKTSMAKAEVFTWLITTARIRRMESGQAHFEDMLNQYTTITNEFAQDGLLLKKEQLEDLVNGVPGGAGLDMAAAWARAIGSYTAYWPQKECAGAILNGGSSGYNSYDGVTFFNTAHPVNGVDTSEGTFPNILNPTTVGGQTRIDSGITMDVAIDNFSRIRAFVASIKSANGVDPRGLQIRGILHPPALRSRVLQLTGPGLIAQAAATGGGSADLAPIIADWKLDKPLEAVELGAGFESPEGNSGSDTSYYLVCGEVSADDELGGLVYQTREPFGVLWHGPELSAKLARERELQWLCQGRNAVGYGHPYLLFRVDNT
jgi:hypothetical protein